MDTQEFARAITSQLLNVVDPRFGDRHDHRFEVQGDQWTDPHQKRTGIPQSHFRQQLARLLTIPARPVTDVRLDRSSTDREIDAWEIAHPTAPHAIIAASNYGGSIRAVKKAIRKKAVEYMRSMPGSDSLANNHRIHDLINECINSPELLVEDAWSQIWDILHYRMGAMSLAENYVALLGLEGPKPGKWNYEEWLVKKRHLEEYQIASACYRMILEAGLIPTPLGSRRRYEKPVWYLAIAFAESRVSKPDIEKKILLASQVMENTIKDCASVLTQTTTFKKQADKWVAGFTK